MVPDINIDHRESSLLAVCEHCLGRINGIRIDGKVNSFTVKSYTETLLLLDQSNSIIHCRRKTNVERVLARLKLPTYLIKDSPT